MAERLTGKDDLTALCKKAPINLAIKRMINWVGQKNYMYAIKKLEEWERDNEDWASPEMPDTILSALNRTKDTYRSKNHTCIFV